MSIIEQLKHDLQQKIDVQKAAYLPKFFKSGPGEYAEGDIFIGITVPDQRKVAKKYYQHVDLNDIKLLLHDPVHEYRLTSLLMLVYKFEKIKLEEDKKDIVDFYLDNYRFINNWDLVDSSADKILGSFLLNKDKSILYDFARSGHLWKQRIAIIATFYFIKNNHFTDTLEISKILLHHKHDLIHKAVGWMLRETGKRDFYIEFEFLKEHYEDMPRTMLRYAIEKFEPKLREQFLKGLVLKE